MKSFHKDRWFNIPSSRGVFVINIAMLTLQECAIIIPEKRKNMKKKGITIIVYLVSLLLRSQEGDI